MFDIEISKGGNFKKEYVKGPQMFRPVMFNPSREEVNEFFGSSKTEPINYISTDEEGNKRVACTLYGFWTKIDGTEEKGIFPSIYVEEINLSSTKTEGVTKYQFIDPFGNTQWAENTESIVSEYFYKNNCRLAFKNEDKLMNLFLKLAGQNTYYSVNGKYPPSKNFTDGKTFLDMDALFKGNFEPYQKVIKNLCTDKSEYTAGHPLRDRRIGVITSVTDDTVTVKQVYYTDKFIAVDKDKTTGKYTMNKYDVNLCLAGTSNVDKNGIPKTYVWAHSGGVLTPQLEVYTPITVESTGSDFDVDANNPFIEEAIDTSIEGVTPFEL